MSRGRDDFTVSTLDLATVQSCINKSLDLFRGTYTGSGSLGGWYHRLATGEPGPSATAVGLSSFYLCGNSHEFMHQGLAFLRARQIRSDDPQRDGGWAVNTSLGHPVTEATGWAARFLGLSHMGVLERRPSSRAACTWLLNNQNDDGGWGSFIGQESRVWLTCMALRAIGVLDPLNEAVADGVQWLLNNKSPSTDAWGVTIGSSPTVPNTALALITLQEVRAELLDGRTSDICDRAYEWLERNVRTDREALLEDASREEVHTVTHRPDPEQVEAWTSTIWHHSLPFALSALVRRPRYPSPEVISAAAHTIVDSQLPEGYWIDREGYGPSVWSVWPFLEALADIGKYCLVRRYDRIFWMSADTLLIQHTDSGP